MAFIGLAFGSLREPSGRCRAVERCSFRRVCAVRYLFCFFFPRRAAPSKSAPLYRLALHVCLKEVHGGREVWFATVLHGAGETNNKNNEPHKPVAIPTSLPPGTSREPPGALLELLWGLSGGPLGVLWGLRAPLGSSGEAASPGEDGRGVSSNNILNHRDRGITRDTVESIGFCLEVL